jgi:Cyclin, N-terminal domain
VLLAGATDAALHMASHAECERPEGDDFDVPLENAWLFTDEELAETPSRVTGVSRETELRILARTATFLQECSRALLIPQLTISVALKFFQRFYMLESMLAHQPPKVAAACLFLSCKVQETHKRLKDIIYWTVKIRTRNTIDFPDGQDIHENSPGYYDEKTAILDKEREVLRLLNFDLTVDHPYKHLWTLNKFFLQPAKADTAADGTNAGTGTLSSSSDRRAVAQSAWNLINDSFRSYIHVRYDPREIATAAIFLAAKLHKVVLQDGTGRCPNTGKRLLAWHEYFGTNLHNIDLICNEMLDLYEPQNVDDE